MAKSYTWDPTYGIRTAGATTDDRHSFASIWQYFHDSPMSADYPYPRTGSQELTENNASQWAGLNGLDTPTDDAVDYTHNSYSVKAEVSSVPSAATFTQMRYTSNYIRLYISNTADYTVGDHILVSGASFGNGIYQIHSISTNSYIQVRPTSDWDDYYNDYDVTENFSVLKPLSLAWNTDISQAHFDAHMCDKLLISAKSDGAGSPKIVGAAIRNYYGSGSGYDRLWYGVQGAKELSLTSSWQDFEFTIRDDMTETGYVKQVGARTYWRNVKQVHVFLDGLSAGEYVWIDGVRLVISDRNPERLGRNSYKMNSGIFCSDYFQDEAFDIIWNILDSGEQGIYFSASNVGDIVFGDYYGVKNYEGGHFQFNIFGGTEDVGRLYLNKVVMHNLNIAFGDRVYGGGQLSGDSSVFRGGKLANVIDYFSASNWTFEKCEKTGGRYGFVGSVNSFNDVIVRKLNNQVLWPANGINAVYRGLEVSDSNYIMYTRNLGYSADRENFRCVNLKLNADCSNPYYFAQENHVSDYGNHVYVAFSFNLIVTDSAGDPISGATVTILNSDSSQAFQVTTGVDGSITEQIVDVLHHYAPNTDQTLYFDTPNTGWAYHNAPFTMTIEKDGYQTVTQILLPDGYDRTSSIVRDGANFEIALQEQTQAGPSFYIDQEQI